MKWSKTIQTRDHVKIISLPCLGRNPVCPYAALKALYHFYNPAANEPLFQYKYTVGWKVLIDSKIRKTLSLINKKLHLSPLFSPFLLSGVQVPLWLLMQMFLFKKLRFRAPGRWIVCGGTFRMIPLVRLKSSLLFSKCYIRKNKCSICWVWGFQ